MTRDVITDLWQLYVSGEASADTRTLVETFLREDPAFAQELREDAGVPPSGHEVPSLTPDHELRTLAQIKRRLGGPRWLLLLHGTGNRPDRIRYVFRRVAAPFIATAVRAALSWVVFFVMLFHGRRDVLVRIRR